MATIKPVRIGQIGVGYWGPNLLRNCMQNSNCEVAKVAELSSARTKYVTDNYPQIQTTRDCQELFDDPDIDAVIIATPVHTHFELATKALTAGKHILVEKPMARTPQEVQQIGRLAEERGLVAMVGHTFLFNSAVRYLKGLIDDGTLGQVRYIYSHRLNLGRIRNDVDALWNLAPHDISIIQYLFGDPKPLQVKAHGMSYVQDGIDDVSFLNLLYPNRLMVNIHVSWLDPLRQRQMIVVGSKKMVVFDDAADDKIMIYDKGIDRMALSNEHMDYDEPSNFVFQYRKGECFIPSIEYLEPVQGEIEHFVDCIQNGTDCITGPEHAMRVVKILHEAKPLRVEQISSTGQLNQKETSVKGHPIYSAENHNNAVSRST